MDIIDEQIKPALMDSTYATSDFKSVLNLGTGYIPVYIAAATSVDEVAVPSANLMFTHPINATRGRKLKISIQVTSSFWASTVDTSSSYIEVDIIEGVGNSARVPYIHSQSVSANEARKSYDFGDDVDRITFCNFDKNGITSALQVIESATIGGDKLNGMQENYFELLSKRNRYFELGSTKDLRGQSFVVFDAFKGDNQGAPLDGAKVNATYNSSNVNGGNNYWVACASQSNRYVQRAFAQAEAKQEEKPDRS